MQSLLDMQWKKNLNTCILTLTVAHTHRTLTHNDHMHAYTIQSNADMLAYAYTRLQVQANRHPHTENIYMAQHRTGTANKYISVHMYVTYSTYTVAVVVAVVYCCCYRIQFSQHQLLFFFAAKMASSLIG